MMFLALCVICIAVMIINRCCTFIFFFFSSRRRHTRYIGDWSSDVCSSDLRGPRFRGGKVHGEGTAAAGTRTDGFDAAAVQLHEPLDDRQPDAQAARRSIGPRSEERRVGKEWRSRWAEGQ